MKAFYLILSFATFMTMNAPNTDLPFKEIPSKPTSYASGNIITRMIDGLGYRYYWASEGLNSADLQYSISESGRNCEETIQHIYDLSVTIRNVAEKKANIRPYQKSELDYETLRSNTLKNLFIARNLFLNTKEEDMNSFTIVFQNGDRKSEFPLWNLMNGQLADAIYHTGQLVVFRRASGNPISAKVRVFTGINAK